MHISLRAVEPEDVALLFNSDNDLDYWPDADMAAPYSMCLMTRYAMSYKADPFSEGQLRLIATDDKGEEVGILDFYEISALNRNAFLGIYILPISRRKGFGRALLNAAIEYASVRLNLNSLAAKIIEYNRVSHHLFASSGFNHVGTLPKWQFANGEMCDILLYARSL